MHEVNAKAAVDEVVHRREDRASIIVEIADDDGERRAGEVAGWPGSGAAGREVWPPAWLRSMPC